MIKGSDKKLLTIFDTYKQSRTLLEGLSRMIADKLDKKDGINDTVKILKLPNIRLKQKNNINFLLKLLIFYLFFFYLKLQRNIA